MGERERGRQRKGTMATRDTDGVDQTWSDMAASTPNTASNRTDISSPPHQSLVLTSDILIASGQGHNISQLSIFPPVLAAAASGVSPQAPTALTSAAMIKRAMGPDLSQREVDGRYSKSDEVAEPHERAGVDSGSAMVGPAMQRASHPHMEGSTDYTLCMYGAGTQTGVVQRTPVQRDGPAKPYNIDDPLGIKSAASAVVARTEAENAPIYSYLDKNKDMVNSLSQGLTSIDALVWQVRHNAPDVDKLSAEQIQQAIYTWAARNNITILKLPQPDQSGTRSELSDSLLSAASGAWTWANDGTTVVKTSTNRWNIRVSGQLSGLVAEVKDKNNDQKSVSILAGFDGSISAQFGAGDYHFSATVSKDAWQVELSLGLDSTVKTVSGLREVFQRAGIGLSTIVKRSPKEITNGTVGADLSSVADAVAALKAVKDAPTVSAGITAGGPLQAGAAVPGQVPQGWSVQATVTVRF